jgi:hypothetical protein
MQSGDPLMAVWDSAVRRGRPRYSHPWLAEAIFTLDVRLRRRISVVEYTHNPLCIFRLQIVHAKQDLILRDATRLRPGQRFVKLHYWNEQVPPAPEAGTTIGWARQMTHRIEISLCELAHYLASEPDLHDVSVVRADPMVSIGRQSEQLARIMARYGFESIAESQPPSPIGERVHRFGENILISLMVFARNASALRANSLTRVPVAIFLSRRALERRFGGSASKRPTEIFGRSGEPG